MGGGELIPSRHRAWDLSCQRDEHFGPSLAVPRRHEEVLEAQAIQIALINVWIRLNAITREMGGAWTRSADEHPDG